MIDDILLQEIFSLREKLKIAIAYIKHYDPAFNEAEFIHQVGSAEYQQWIDDIGMELQNGGQGEVLALQSKLDMLVLV